ncbi:hypothetical protein ENUP19_0054G0054 [Entamoeba nuttalli]|uniref:Uncharacterized protein n=1 Tax=Entamoeba nuttalli TaxID=412467 RepID=A0ABQ0DC99_9EUKA
MSDRKSSHSYGTLNARKKSLKERKYFDSAEWASGDNTSLQSPPKTQIHIPHNIPPQSSRLSLNSICIEE